MFVLAFVPSRSQREKFDLSLRLWWEQVGTFLSKVGVVLPAYLEKPFSQVCVLFLAWWMASVVSKCELLLACLWFWVGGWLFCADSGCAIHAAFMLGENSDLFCLVQSQPRFVLRVCGCKTFPLFRRPASLKKSQELSHHTVLPLKKLLKFLFAAVVRENEVVFRLFASHKNSRNNSSDCLATWKD